MSCINCYVSTQDNVPRTHFVRKKASDTLRCRSRRFLVTAEEALEKFQSCARLHVRPDNAPLGKERFLCLPCYNLLVQFVKSAEDAAKAARALKERAPAQNYRDESTTQKHTFAAQEDRDIKKEPEDFDEWSQIFQFQRLLCPEEEHVDIGQPSASKTQKETSVLKVEDTEASSLLANEQKDSERSAQEEIDCSPEVDTIPLNEPGDQEEEATNQCSADVVDQDTCQQSPADCDMKTKNGRKSRAQPRKVESKRGKGAKAVAPSRKRSKENSVKVKKMKYFKCELTGKFQCKICSHESGKRCAMQQHVRDNHKGVSHLCWACGEHFADTRMLQRHITVRHHARSELRLCSVCGASFGSAEGLRLHSSMHTNPADTVCQICQKKFSSRLACQTHMKGVHLGVTHQCLTCNKVFRYKPTLYKHRQRCGRSQPKEYECTMCHKIFTRKDTLTEHVDAIHWDSKRYKCDHCGVHYKFRTSLVRHRTGGCSAEGRKLEQEEMAAPEPSSNHPAVQEIDQTGLMASCGSELVLAGGDVELTDFDGETKIMLTDGDGLLNTDGLAEGEHLYIIVQNSELQLQ